MQRISISILSFTVIAIVAVSAGCSPDVYAEESGDPAILPTPTVAQPTTFVVKSFGEPVIETTSALTILCRKATGAGEFTSQRLGTISIEFQECKRGTSNCGTLGVIRSQGDLHLVDVLPTGTLDLGLEILPLEGGANRLKFKCGIPTFEVSGSVLGVVDAAKGELLKDLEKGKEVKVLWKREVKEGGEVFGEQQIKTCDLTKEFCIEGGGGHRLLELKMDLGLGAELAALVGAVTLVFEKEVEFHL